jgi:hypothetical protein
MTINDIVIIGSGNVATNLAAAFKNIGDSTYSGLPDVGKQIVNNLKNLR